MVSLKGHNKGHPCYSITPEGKYLGGRPLEWNEERIEEVRLKLEEWLLIPSNFWFDDFVLEHKLPSDILARLAKKSDTFLATYKRAVMNQQSKLFKSGLFNITNPAVSIFGLKCNHGWTDGQLRTGIEEPTETRSTRAIDAIKEVAVEHAASIEVQPAAPLQVEAKAAPVAVNKGNG